MRNCLCSTQDPCVSLMHCHQNIFVLLCFTFSNTSVGYCLLCFCASGWSIYSEHHQGHCCLSEPQSLPPHQGTWIRVVIQFAALHAGSSGSSEAPTFQAVAFFCLTQTHIFPDVPLSHLKRVVPLIIIHAL